MITNTLSTIVRTINNKLQQWKNWADSKFAFKLLPTLISLFVFTVIYALPRPAELTSDAWLMLSLFVALIVAIIFKAMPIGALSLISVTIVVLTKAGSTNTEMAIRDALTEYSNPLIWLIVIAIFISRGLISTGLGSRIGYYFISILGKKTLGIGYGLAISELLLAPFTPSNTARGGAIMHPIMRSIASAFNSNAEDGSASKMGTYLALVNYHCNPITSAMFITATAPNPLTVQLIATATGGAVKLTWTTWAYAMIVPGIMALLVMPLLIYWINKPEIKDTPHATNFAKSELKRLGSLGRKESIMIAIFVLLLILWADIPSLILGPNYLVSPTSTAMLGLSLLLLTGILKWDDVLKEKSAWDTLFWFGALIMMANQLNKLGLVSWFSDHLQTWIISQGMEWPIGCLILILTFLYAHYFFASTTAHVSAMMLAFLTVGISLGAPVLPFSLLMAAASSIMMSLTHYATGTSPIIFGSGYVSLGLWWKTGFIVSLSNLVIWIIIGGVWWRILGLW